MSEQSRPPPPSMLAPRCTLETLVGMLNTNCRVPKSGGFFRVTLRKTTFHELVNYCLDIEPPNLEHIGLPPRGDWRGDPILLMDDSERDRGVFQYVVTDYCSLSKARPGAFSEVFLEGHLITTVSFDVDRKCLPGDFDLEQDLGGIVGSFIRMLRIAVQKFRGVTVDSLEKLGELAVYVRKGAIPTGKFSARFLWFPPYELCFSSVTQLAAFTREVCAVMDENDSFFTYLTTSEGREEGTKKCALDAMPFHRNKSCRLPNATKITDGKPDPFEYVRSFNSTILSEKNYRSMAVGISRSPVLLDRPSLGNPHLETAVGLFSSLGSAPSVADFSEQISVSEGRVEWFKEVIAKVWGSYKMTPTERGSIRFTPTHPGSSTCLLHNTVHRKSAFSVVLTERYVYPRCFNDSPPFISVPSGHFVHLLETNGNLSLATKPGV
uniref:Non-structural core protein n=1 Tax=Latid herpesvirus 1 TaxID=3096545 RepID=A0AB33V975_9VIRU